MILMMYRGIFGVISTGELTMWTCDELFCTRIREHRHFGICRNCCVCRVVDIIAHGAHFLMIALKWRMCGEPKLIFQVILRRAKSQPLLPRQVHSLFFWSAVGGGQKLDVETCNRSFEKHSIALIERTFSVDCLWPRISWTALLICPCK